MHFIDILLHFLLFHYFLETTSTNRHFVLVAVISAVISGARNISHRLYHNKVFVFHLVFTGILYPILLYSILFYEIISFILLHELILSYYFILYFCMVSCPSVFTESKSFFILGLMCYIDFSNVSGPIFRVVQSCHKCTYKKNINYLLTTVFCCYLFQPRF